MMTGLLWQSVVMACLSYPGKWWTEVMLPALQNYDVAYGLVWRNAYDRPDHYFGPFPGQASAEDFKTFSANPRVFMESKLPSMYR